MVSYQQTKDLSASAKITYVNMRSYYENYSVDWDCSKIEEQIQDLANFDILFNDEAPSTRPGFGKSLRATVR